MAVGRNDPDMLSTETDFSSIKQSGLLPVHEQVFRELRDNILFGGFLPGRPVTLRGLASALGVSPMPIREAIRRLIAERALELHDNRRVSVPAMTREKFDQICFARSALEPELASRALPYFGSKELAELEAIDQSVDRSIETGDLESYMRSNCLFHFTLYRASRADTLVALVESIWLQFAPFMRSVYGRFGTARLDDQHRRAILAIEKRSEDELRSAIKEDIMQGMRFIGEAALND